MVFSILNMMNYIDNHCYTIQPIYKRVKVQNLSSEIVYQNGDSAVHLGRNYELGTRHAYMEGYKLFAYPKNLPVCIHKLINWKSGLDG
jgi:hypothetical protein